MQEKITFYLHLRDKEVWIDKPLLLHVQKEIPLSLEDEGRMLFFPAWLQHQVFPFYECEEERITISGNIIYNLEKKNESFQR